MTHLHMTTKVYLGFNSLSDKFVEHISILCLGPHEPGTKSSPRPFRAYGCHLGAWSACFYGDCTLVLVLTSVAFFLLNQLFVELSFCGPETCLNLKNTTQL